MGAPEKMELLFTFALIILCRHQLNLSGVMQVPDEIQYLVNRDCIIFSRKANYFLKAGRFSFDDLKNSLLNGYVRKKERDETGEARYKYTIIGPALSGEEIYSCGKIVRRKGKQYFIITFHE